MIPAEVTKMPKNTIAIASGKGGTGKTTFAVNLAYVTNSAVTLMDCDVEAPNAHLFLDPEWVNSEEVAVLNPLVDENKCNGCKECKNHCRFNAIAVLKGEPLISLELCHSCGACLLACPEQAITEFKRPIGSIKEGSREHIKLFHGQLNIGEVRSPALIDQLRTKQVDTDLLLIDAPPGASCATIAAIKNVDFLILVTEPTPLGLNDLKISIQMAKSLGIKTGVIINKSDVGSAPVREYCATQQIPIISELKFDPKLAKAYSNGQIIAAKLPEYYDQFSRTLERVKEMIR